MAHDALAIANAFLELAERDGKTVTPLQVQKLVYLAHGWNLAIFGEPLIDEPVEAWPYGPVVPSVYHEFKSFGRGAIDRPAFRVAPGPGFRVVDVPAPQEQPVANLLTKVWEVYRGFSGIELSNMTHVAGSPWSITTDGGRKVDRGVTIEDETIKSYFEALGKGKN